MKILLFGTGDYYERYKKWFDKKDVQALLDNSLQKQGKLIDGYRVLLPKEGVKLSFDVIVILSVHVKLMKEQLIELGVHKDRIYHFYNLHDLIYKKERKKPVVFYGNAESIVMSKDRQKKILLLSQDMMLGGATIALFHAAKILNRNGYKVVFASMVDGPLRKDLLSENISVVVDVNLQLETMKEAEWTNNFSMLFCNTINFYVFLSERDSSIPIIWWLHDPAFFYDGIDSALLRRLDRTNMRIYSVGEIPANVIRRFIPEIKIEDLLYGVEDTGEYDIKSECLHDDKIIFVTIGEIGEVKGQDILVQSIQALPEGLRKKAVFILIGRKISAMAQRLQEEIKYIPEIVMTGVMGRKELNGILNKVDVLICPSREDVMPTVAAEAMMHQVPCIISDTAGTAKYIQDGINGFVFRNSSINRLSEKIKWCIENRKELHDIGICSKRIYDTYFSMEIFRKNLLNIINDIEKQVN